MDPKHPGAVDEIINLGEYWDSSKISAHKDEILECTGKTGRLYKTAYSMLKEAKVAYDEGKSYIEESMDVPVYNRIVKNLLDEVFKGVESDYITPVKHRHLFGSAITPDGLVNYIDTLISPGMKVFSLTGEPGTGVKEAISRIAGTALEIGLYAEEFHCPFEPELLDMVIIPSINTAVVNSTRHCDILNLNLLNIIRIDFNTCIRQQVLDQYRTDLENSRERYYSLLANAVSHISRAKAVHDDMEKYYVSAMNFDMIEAKRRETLKRILDYADK